MVVILLSPHMASVCLWYIEIGSDYMLLHMHLYVLFLVQPLALDCSESSDWEHREHMIPRHRS